MSLDGKLVRVKADYARYWKWPRETMFRARRSGVSGAEWYWLDDLDRVNMSHGVFGREELELVEE